MWQKFSSASPLPSPLSPSQKTKSQVVKGNKNRNENENREKVHYFVKTCTKKLFELWIILTATHKSINHSWHMENLWNFQFQLTLKQSQCNTTIFSHYSPEMLLCRLLFQWSHYQKARKYLQMNSRGKSLEINYMNFTLIAFPFSQTSVTTQQLL